MASSDFSPASSSAPVSERGRKLLGTTVGGRYKVLSPLGHGTMGEVFLVEHVTIRRRMALKVLSDEMSKSPEAVTRFEREALASAHIDHPNVVAATDSGRTEDGALFVVFEYVDGQSLHERIAQGPLAPPLAVRITRQVVSALVRAHGIGIIHRDIKPQNIMLVSHEGDEPLAKVLDFGLAKLSVALLSHGGDGAEVLTRAGTVFGTPAYLSPEQGAGGEVDGRTDLYAVGVLLYQMLTGVVPFVGDGPAVLRQHLAAPVPALASRAPGLRVPPALEAMVRKLLEKRPEDRYESAKVLLSAIDALIKAEKPPRESSAAASNDSAVNENETMVAPPDLPAKLYAQLPPGERSESLLLALKRIKDQPGAKERNDDDPSLSGLAVEAGAQQTAGTSAAGVPPMLATAEETPNEPPKLRIPSSLDIEARVPEAAAAAVLTPTPPPTLLESAREAVGDAVASLRSGDAPAAPGGPARSTVLRARAAERYAELLGAVRARLPERHRGISQRLLGLGVGAVLTLPLLFLIWIVTSGDSDSSASRSAMPGFASDREMERAAAGDVRELEMLASKYPSDSRVFRILTRKHAARKDFVGAVRSLSTLARLDLSMASDDEMSQIAAAAVQRPETADAAISLLESQLGDKGIGLLSDLAETATTEPAKSRLSASLQKATTRAQASEATLVLLDLRAAPRCEDKRALLRRAGQQGDARTLSYLQGLQQTTTGCGPAGQSDCWSCLRKSPALKAAQDALSKRLSGS